MSGEIALDTSAAIRFLNGVEDVFLYADLFLQLSQFGQRFLLLYLTATFGACGAVSFRAA